MAISSFGRGKGEGDAVAPPKAVSGAGANLTAFIDQGSEFEGKLTFKDTVRIDGKFQGEISSENTLIVGESGEIVADIQSQTIVVSGAVEGDIVATKKVVLHKTARVEGNLHTPSLVIEEGASVNGHVKMGAAAKQTTNLKAIDGNKGKDAGGKPQPNQG